MPTQKKKDIKFGIYLNNDATFKKDVNYWKVTKYK